MIKQYTRKYAVILDLLDKESGTVSLAALCTRYRVSQRTMRSEIQDIRKILKEYQLSLKKEKGVHYYIEHESVQQRLDMEHLRRDIEQQSENLTFESINDRMLYLFRRLILSSEYLKLTDLSEEMYISKSTISADMKKVREILASYTLTISNKPHYGVKVEGSEEKIRECILDYGLIDQDIFSPNGSLDIWSNILHDADYAIVEQVVTQILAQKAYQMFSIYLNNLIMHVLLAVKRIRSHCFVAHTMLENPWRYKKEYALSCRIMQGMEAALHMEVPESERIYLQFHLVGKQNEGEADEEYGELQQLAEQMIESSSETYNCSFFQDDTFRKDLFTHLKAVKSRLDVGARLRNPMLSEIKGQYPFAFEIAVNSVKQSWNSLRSMSEDEIGYIAIHYAASLARMKGHFSSRSKNILILCASGIGTARLTEVRLRQYFRESLNITVQISPDGLHSGALYAYDLILTTMPIMEEYPNMLRIHTMPLPAELEQIQALLYPDKPQNFTLKQIFQKDLFEIRQHAQRDTLLKEISSQLFKKGFVQDGFYEGVQEREACSATSVGNFVALPHSIRPMALQSAIYTCIIKNPVKWEKDNEVQIVFLLAIKFRDSKYFSEIYDLIVQITENMEFVSTCIACTSYDEFIELLEKTGQERKSQYAK